MVQCKRQEIWQYIFHHHLLRTKVLPYMATGILFEKRLSVIRVPFQKMQVSVDTK